MLVGQIQGPEFGPQNPSENKNQKPKQCTSTLVASSPAEAEIRYLGFIGQPLSPNNSESQVPVRDLAPEHIVGGPERWLSGQRNFPPKNNDLRSFPRTHMVEGENRLT